MMISIILWRKWWSPTLFIFRLFSLTVLTNNLFTIKKSTKLTSYRTNLECFWITLSDCKSVFEQMSCFKRRLTRIRVLGCTCHNHASVWRHASVLCTVSVNRERYSSQLKLDRSSTGFHLSMTCHVRMSLVGPKKGDS